MNDKQLQELIDKQAIREVLSRYCRALDRMDKNMAYAVWHEQGTAHYLDLYEGSGRGFVDWVWEAHAAMERHSHQINNLLITINGDKAQSEAYVTVALWTCKDQQGQQQEIIARSRYLDQWSYQQGRWAIDQRTHVLDMQTTHPLIRGEVNNQSTRDRNDASYQLFQDN